MAQRVRDQKRPILISCPPFDENSGGRIVLHYLVDRLRALGIEAYACPLIRRDYSGVRPAWLRALKTYNRFRHAERFRTHPDLDVPLAPRRLYKEAIFVYPDIVQGNPYGAKRVARWMLYRRGFSGDDAKVPFGEEMFFFQEAFVAGIEGVSATNLLRVQWLREDIYRDQGLTRQGSCRMIRKGQETVQMIPSPDTSIPLDGKSHEEISEIFNRTEVFYCHDPYTMYAYYAALCGCIPIVIPKPGLSREEWRAGFSLKHGVAYGEDMLEWARETRDQLISDMAAEKQIESDQIMRFVATLRKRFG